VNLSGIRQEIDGIDSRIVVLLAQRWQLVKEAARYKTTEEQLLAPGRQQQVIANVRRAAEQHGLPPHLAEEVYRTIMGNFIALERREAGL
jgi:isochorismate pyruvate lyase